MSVRRLAADPVQPASFAFSAENQAWAEKLIARYPAGRQQSAVIPMLWRAQEQEGWVTRASIEAVAKMLGMAYIRVLEVATFYTQFLLKPVGSNAHIIVCGTTPCMLRGAGDLIEICQHKIAHDPLEVSADGKLSWEEAECLGACVNAPMIMIGNDTYEDLTTESFEALVEAFRAGNGKSVKVGTQINRALLGCRGRRDDAARKADRPAHLQAIPAATAAGCSAAAPAAPAAAPAAPAPAAARPLLPRAGTDQQRSSARGGAEGAPALKGPPNSPKVSEAKANGEREAVNAAAKGRWRAEPRDARRRNRCRVAGRQDRWRQGRR